MEEEAKLRELALSDYNKAKALEVNDTDSYRDACFMELQLKEEIKRREDRFDPMVEKARAAWKESLRLRASALEKLEDALDWVQSLRVAYEQRSENERLAMEREGQQRATEKARQEADSIAKMLDDTGEKALAEQVRSTVQVPIYTLDSAIPIIPGIRTRDVWQYRIVDEKKISRQYLSPDDKKIKPIVLSQGRSAEVVVGGIEVYVEKHAVGRRK